MSSDQAVVLVGGLGTRLRGLVADTPKPLAQVAGRPFLAWVLDELARSGLRRIVLATGYLADKVEQSIGDHWCGMDVAYSLESQPLGTGGAVRNALPLLTGEGVHVVNGDTFLRYSPRALEATTRRLGASIGIALAHVADTSRYGAVEVCEGYVSAFREKGRHGPGDISAGCYFLTPEALQDLPRCEAFSMENDVLHPKAGSGDIAAFTETADFIDIGVPEDYVDAQVRFAALP